MPRKPNKENRAVRCRAYLSGAQLEAAMRTIGCCRYVYNEALSYEDAEYREHGRHVSYEDLTSRLPGMKKRLPWLKDADSSALQQSLRHLDTAYRNFFERRARFPKYKSKHRSRWSYTTLCINNNIRFEDGFLVMPKIGRVRIVLTRDIPAGWKLKSATLTVERDRTVYISCCFEYEAAPVSYVPDVNNAIGLDYKSDGFYVDSGGNTCGSPKYMRKTQDVLTRRQRKLRHKKKGSRNYAKQKARIARIYRHAANQRLDFCHKLSAWIANRYDIVCVEDLDLKAMAGKGTGNGKATMDNAWGMFLRFLEYKLRARGKALVKVGRWFPSSQICSACGARHAMPLSVRTYVCPECGAVMNRDENAAANILKEGIRLYLLAAA